MSKTDDSKEWYFRNLPHWQPPDAVLFITACLDGALPKHRVQEIKDERNLVIERLKKEGHSENTIKAWLAGNHDDYFGKYDSLLDGSDHGPHYLKQPELAQIVMDSLLHFHGSRYKLICFTIMSNHIHVVWYQFNSPLFRVMQSFKQFTSKRINQLLNRTGTFWQAETWDRNIRDRRELAIKIAYTLNNPVKAGLVKHWSEWPFSWLNPEFKHWML